MSVCYEANVLLALAGAGNNFSERKRGVWVDCVVCGRRDALRGDDALALSDDEATVVFESHGWSVLPTLCPEHKETP